MLFSEKMNLFKYNTVINWHEHVWFDENGEMDRPRLDMIVRAARETHMDKLVCSLPILEPEVSPELFKKCNDAVYEAMRLYPDLIEGMAFVNPGYQKESLEEIDRCINGLGMVGIKLYNQFLISDPVVNTIIEKVSVLMYPSLSMRQS